MNDYAKDLFLQLRFRSGRPMPLKNRVLLMELLDAVREYGPGIKARASS